MPHEIPAELYAHIEKGRNDLPYFAENILGITLNKGQGKAWDSTSKKYFPTNIYLCGNRAGKTVYIAIKHIWKNFYKIPGPGKHLRESDWEFIEYKTMNCAPHSNQTKIMYRTIMRILRGQFAIPQTDGTMVRNLSLAKWFIDYDGSINPDEPPKAGPYEIKFANDTKFCAFTMGGGHGDSLQGDAFAYASYDEAGRSKEPNKEHDDITTRLADWVGELDMITTPDETNEDASDWLVDKVEQSKNNDSPFRFISWATTDNEYMGQRSIDTLLAGKTPEQQRRILKGDLVKNTSKFFTYKKLEAIFREAPKYIDFKYQYPRADRLYFAGCDTAGMGKDQWAFYVVDYTSKPYKIVYQYASKNATPTENREFTRNIIEQFYDSVGRSNFKWMIDFTSEGGTIVWDNMQDLDPIPFRFGIEKGSGRNMKVELLNTLRRVVTEEALISPEDLALHSQMIGYRGPKDDKTRITDRVMALALAVYTPYLEGLVKDEETVFDIN